MTSVRITNSIDIGQAVTIDDILRMIGSDVKLVLRPGDSLEFIYSDEHTFTLTARKNNCAHNNNKK